MHEERCLADERLLLQLGYVKPSNGTETLLGKQPKTFENDLMILAKGLSQLHLGLRMGSTVVLRVTLHNFYLVRIRSFIVLLERSLDEPH